MDLGADNANPAAAAADDGSPTSVAMKVRARQRQILKQKISAKRARRDKKSNKGVDHLKITAMWTQSPEFQYGAVHSDDCEYKMLSAHFKGDPESHAYNLRNAVEPYTYPYLDDNGVAVTRWNAAGTKEYPKKFEIACLGQALNMQEITEYMQEIYIPNFAKSQLGLTELDKDEWPVYDPKVDFDKRHYWTQMLSMKEIEKILLWKYARPASVTVAKFMRDHDRIYSIWQPGEVPIRYILSWALPMDLLVAEDQQRFKIFKKDMEEKEKQKEKEEKKVKEEAEEAEWSDVEEEARRLLGDDFDLHEE